MKGLITVTLFFATMLCLTAQAKQPGYSEDISIFTDRDIYISGENLWFRISCNAQPGEPDSVISRIIYLELYDQKFNSIVRSKYMVNKGFAAGHLVIPPDINTGNYFLRTYTQYSRNFHPYAFSTVMISVVNPSKPLPNDESVREAEMLAVPSGGKLIAGLSSSTAVKLTPSLCNRNPVINLTDNAGRVIQSATASGNGLAIFDFTPVAGTNYNIVVNDSLTGKMSKPLSVVQEKGTLMRTGVLGSNIKAGIISNSEETGRYEVEVRTYQGQILYQNRIKIGNTLVIPTEGKTGILFVMLRDNDSIVDIQPVFINGNTCRPLSVKGGGSFGSREKISLDVDAPGGATDEFVTVSAKEAHFDENGMLPWYLPYNPALFTNYINQVPVITDSLYRQIEITMILYAELFRESGFQNRLQQNVVDQWLPEIRDAGISGQIIDRITRKPLENIKVYASVVNDNNQIHIYKTGRDGRFFFTLNHLSGTHDVYLSPEPVNGLNLDLLVNTDFETNYPESAGIIPFLPDTAFVERLNSINLNARLSKIFPKYSTEIDRQIQYYPLPKVNQNHSVILADYIEMPVMSEVFSEIVPFVTVKKKDNRYSLQVFDDRLGVTYNEPLVLFDGIPLFNINQIMEVDPVLIKKIDVTNTTSFIGNFSFDGLISISSHQKDFAGITLPETSKFIEFQGITNENYPVFPELAGKKDDRNPDFRTLLFWNRITPGQKSVTFTTSDNAGEYEVVVYATDGKATYIGNTTINLH